MRVSDFGTPMLIEGLQTFPVLIYTQFMGEVAPMTIFAASLCDSYCYHFTAVFINVISSRALFLMTALKPMEAVEAKGSKILPIFCLWRCFWQHLN